MLKFMVALELFAGSGCRPGTVGRSLKGISNAILDPDENGCGEIITSGRNIMMGYAKVIHRYRYLWVIGSN